MIVSELQVLVDCTPSVVVSPGENMSNFFLQKIYVNKRYTRLVIPAVCPVCPLTPIGNRLVPRPFRVVAIELVERKPPNRVSPTCAVMAYLIRSVVLISLQLVIIRILIVLCSPVFEVRLR